jgi:hypothetical protein
MRVLQEAALAHEIVGGCTVARVPLVKGLQKRHQMKETLSGARERQWFEFASQQHSHKYATGVLRMHIVVPLVKKRHPQLLVGHNVVVQCTIFGLAFHISAAICNILLRENFKIFKHCCKESFRYFREEHSQVTNNFCHAFHEVPEELPCLPRSRW